MKRCECGAHKTVNSNMHSAWCPMFNFNRKVEFKGFPIVYLDKPTYTSPDGKRWPVESILSLDRGNADIAILLYEPFYKAQSAEVLEVLLNNEYATINYYISTRLKKTQP